MSAIAGSPWFRRTLIVFGAAALLGLSGQVSVVNIVRKASPGLALKFDSTDARAQATMAEAMIKPQMSADSRAKARSLAEGALRRDPTIASAARTLGVIEDIEGRRANAKRFLTYSASISHRDVPTQIWLIEEAVGRNDTAGALHHFDIALRSSYRSGTLLIPILVDATEDARLLPDIAQTLSRRPWWSDGYQLALVQTGKSLQNIATLFSDLHRRRVPITDEVSNALIVRLVQSGEFLLGWQAYRHAHPDADVNAVRNGNFEREDRPVPFEWQMANEIDRAGERSSAPNGSIGLSFYASRGAGGDIARQLIVLRPGTYRISGISRNVQDGTSRPFWSIECARDTTNIAFLPLSASTERAQRFSANFAVPTGKGCEAQWLTLRVKASDETGNIEGEIDDVAISPRVATP